MKQVLFTGYYGQDNMGDDFFGLVSIWGAQKFWNEKDIALLSSKGPMSEEITIRYTLPKKQLFKGGYLFQSIWNIIQAKIIILSGGSILHSKPKIISLERILFVCSKFGISKVGAIGVSLGPFKSEKNYKYIKRQLKNFKFLVLRDKQSYDIAVSMDLPYQPILGADLAFMLPELHYPLGKKENSSTKIIGISICHYESYVDGDVNNERRREAIFLETLLELLKVDNIKLRFFIINGNDIVGDKKITLEIIKKLKVQKEDYELVEYSADTFSMLDKLSECDTIFTTRLHGAIFSASLNIPSLLVEYHPKCTAYLNDIGLDNNWRIGDMNLQANEIKDKILTLSKSNQIDFYPRRDKLQSLSLNNFKEVEI